MKKTTSLALSTGLYLALGLTLGLSLLMGAATTARAHCEIPCGIYGDATRFVIMREDIATIEKSMKQIKELEKAGDKNYNQLVRWIMNKEKHATKLQEIVWQYFLTQRIKPLDAKSEHHRKDYQRQLELLHLMTVYAMKCKQTVDLQWVEKLKAAVDAFEKAYMPKKK